MSQEKFAEKCGIHRTYVSDVERGSRNPSFLTLLAIAHGLGVTISELTRDMKTDIAPNQSGVSRDWAQLANKVGKSTSLARPYLSRE
jgi:transcriptional regulator with XRE-family HTH domain